MNNKILITVKVPMIEEQYDIYVPIFKTIGVTIKLISKTINELSSGYFPIKESYTLLSNKGIPYNLNSTIKESGLKNADIVTLI